MACNESTNDTRGSTVEKIQKDFLSCPICYEIYDQPKCLPCLHTFCHTCLGSYIESQRDMGAVRKKGFLCPICKQFVFVKSSYKHLSEWVDDIQKNFLIQNMIDSLKPESKSMSPPRSGDTTSTDTSSPDPATSTPLLQPESITRAVPSAPPLNPWSGTSRKLPFPDVHYDAELDRYVLDDSVSNRDMLSAGYHPEEIRPSRSTTDRAVNTNSSPVANNLFRNRSNSSGGLNRHETVTLFTETPVLWRCVYKPNLYCKDPQFSDVCCLPKQNSIVVTDYNNHKVVLYGNLFYRTYYLKKVKVKGRPCSITLLDEEKENCVVVNLEMHGILVFISVPDMKILRQVKTSSNYHCAAALSPYTLIVGSATWPASIELIKINPPYDISKTQVLIKNGLTWDLSSPDHICVLSPTSFMVSDSGKKSLICYDIVEDQDSRTKRAVKRFCFKPRADRKFECPGGLFFDRSSQSVYTVDTGNHSVLQVVPGDTLLCETVLTGSDNVCKPTSVCLGPQNQLCVVDWEGYISVYEQTVS